MSRHRLLPALLAALALTAACSDDSTSSSTSPAATDSVAPDMTPPPSTEPATTVSAADQAAAYTEAGSYPVGVTTLELADGTPVEVWYPAVPGTTGTESYDVRDYVPDAVKALLTTDVPVGASYPAGRDAAVADGAFPIVLFSHGFTGIRVQSTFLTAHLASWGMVVVSPEHPSRDLFGVLTRFISKDTTPVDRNASVNDLLGSLDLILAAGDDAASPFHGHLDAEHIAAVGHSAGGGTVLGAAADERIDGYVSLASGVLRGGTATDATTTTTPVVMPAKPSLFVAGSVDGVVSVDEVTRPAYDAAPSPSALWVIEGAGHNAFDDFCTFGNGTGIIGVADASGVGPLLDTATGLRKLGEDGCKPPAVPVADTFPIINHVVTSWLRQLFALDADAVGLGADVAGEYATPVEISTK